MGLLDRLFGALGFGGGSGTRPDRGVYRYVRCDRCKDVVRIRINMANEVSELSDAGDGDEDTGGLAHADARFAIRKGVVDAKCFRPMRLTILFDGRKREVDSSVEGGSLVDEKAWLAARGGGSTG